MPENDYKIIVLTAGDHNGPESRIRRWSDEQLRLDLTIATGTTYLEDVLDPQAIRADTQAFVSRATSILDSRGGITGVSYCTTSPPVVL